MTRQTSDSTLAYNSKDVIATWDCAKSFFHEIHKPAAQGRNSFDETYEHTISIYEPCMFMQSRGVLVDRVALDKEKINVGKRIEELGEEINRRCGRAINPNSPQDLQKYFYIEKGIPPYTKLNDKKESVITCDDKALQRIARGTSARQGLREAALIQEWKKLSKLKGTYLDMIIDSDSRIRSSYNPRGTRFARLSSSKTIFETGMNQQNLHPAFLSFLVADPGCVFVSLDKRQAEWVAVAYATGDENMISAVERGIDVHAWTGAQMCRVPVELIAEENKALGHMGDPEEIGAWRKAHPLFSQLIAQEGRWFPRTMSIRQCGKKSNHGLNYDESFKMFALINELTEKEAKSVVEFYHRAYPGIRRWYEWIKRELQTNGRVLENFFGRPYRFLGSWNQDLWKSAYSYIPQSSIGELVNRGMAGIYYDKAEELANVEILQQVHDSLLIQIPLGDSNIGQAVLRAKRHLEPTLKSGGREFTIATDMKVGFNLRDMVEVEMVESGDQQAELMRTAAARLKEEVVESTVR